MATTLQARIARLEDQIARLTAAGADPDTIGELQEMLNVYRAVAQ